MVRLFVILVLVLLAPVHAEEAPVDVKEILRKIDHNMNSISAITESTMEIVGARDKRVISSKTWSTKTGSEDKSFVEYLSPPREKGIKMLKVGSDLWVYYPEPTNRTIKISGHMLRDSVMGSDLSYEDMMAASKLEESYNVHVESDKEVVGGKPVWRLKLVAKNPEVAYQARLLYVDKVQFLPLKQSLLAKNGDLLKTLEIKETMVIKDRFYPKVIYFKDELKEGSGGTTFTINKINLDSTIAPQRFTKAAFQMLSGQ